MTTVKFKFNLLTPEIYARFVELIIPRNIDNFIRTSKKNHISLFKRQGISVKLQNVSGTQKPFKFKDGELTIDNLIEERYLEALESLPQFVPYFKYHLVYMLPLYEDGPLPYPRINIPDRTTIKAVIFKPVRKEYYINDIEYIYSTFYHEKLFNLIFEDIDLEFDETFEFIEYVLGKMSKTKYIKFYITDKNRDIIRHRAKLIKIPKETVSFSLEFEDSMTSKDYFMMYCENEWWEGYDE